MSLLKYFRSTGGDIPLPIFFPDATRGFIKSIDISDLESTKTSGVLVNTYHLYKEVGFELIKKTKGIRKYMNFTGGVISDSGGFQVGSLIKRNPNLGKVSDKGVSFKFPGEGRTVLTPEDSIKFQMELGTDMVVVLDDFTPPNATYKEARETVERTIAWAKRSKNEFEKISKKTKKTPYILGVVQGGYFQDLRKYCTQELVKIGFDGLGYGGWPKNEDNSFDYESAKTILENLPKGYLLYGLGIGKPDEIVNLVKLGFNIFDCVLPTRDARHGRLYVYNFDSIGEIDVKKEKFYSYFSPRKMENKLLFEPVSKACDCLLCTKYTKSYLYHLFKMGDTTAGRLATIHNLRFYSILMEKIRTQL